MIDKMTKTTNQHVEEMVSNFETELRTQRILLESGEINREFKSEQERERRYLEIINHNEDAYAKINLLEGELEKNLSLVSSEELSEAFEKYKGETSGVIQSKNQLINGLIRDLKIEEELFLKSLAEWSKDFDFMLSSSKEKVQNVTEVSQTSLKTFEAGLIQQRKEVMKINKKELEDMLKKHELLETNLSNERESEEERNFHEITVLRQTKNREFFSTKQHMEKTIQDHDKCLEYMRAVYLLNGEKLNYNLKVLEAKKKENASLILILKKKERFFLNLLKRKNDDFALKYSEFGKANSKLTVQTKSLTKRYRELHLKFEHFERSDLDKCQEIRTISIAKLNDLRNKILGINRVIMNQQLGITVEENANSNDFFGQIPLSKGQSPMTLNREDSVKFESSQYVGRGSEAFLKRDKDGKQNMMEDIQRASLLIPNHKRLELLELILAETDFLFDDKVLSEIQDYSSEEEKLVTKMNVIRKTFSLSSQFDLNDLLVKLHLNVYNSETDQYKQSKIIPNLVKLIESVPSKTSRSNRINAADKVSVDDAARQNDNSIFHESKKVLEDDFLEVWKELDKFSLKYLNLLQNRKTLMEENKHLESKNQEIESLLRVYEKDNTMLIYPPKMSLSNDTM